MYPDLAVLSNRYRQEFDRRTPPKLRPKKKRWNAGPIHKIKPDKYDLGWCYCRNQDHHRKGCQLRKALRDDLKKMEKYFRMVRDELKTPLAVITIT